MSQDQQESGASITTQLTVATVRRGQNHIHKPGCAGLKRDRQYKTADLWTADWPIEEALVLDPMAGRGKRSLRGGHRGTRTKVMEYHVSDDRVFPSVRWES